MKTINNISELTKNVKNAIVNHPAYSTPCNNEFILYSNGSHHATTDYSQSELLTTLNIVLNIGFENYDSVAYHNEHMAICGNGNTNINARIFQIFCWITYGFDNVATNRHWKKLNEKLQIEINLQIEEYILHHVNYILDEVIETTLTPIAIKTITVSELKYQVSETGSHYFERSSMKFFGDTMKNYGIRKHNDLTAYELTRKQPVKHGLSNSQFFDAITFEKLSNTEIQNRA